MFSNRRVANLFLRQQLLLFIWDSVKAVEGECGGFTTFIKSSAIIILCLLEWRGGCTICHIKFVSDIVLIEKKSLISDSAVFGWPSIGTSPIPFL